MKLIIHSSKFTIIGLTVLLVLFSCGGPKPESGWTAAEYFKYALDICQPGVYNDDKIRKQARRGPGILDNIVGSIPGCPRHNRLLGIQQERRPSEQPFLDHQGW